jgi:hypothetical protein
VSIRGSKHPSIKEIIMPTLEFNTIDPIAPSGLAGLVRDQFAHGRLHAIVGSHGGLLEIHYWGRQRLGHSKFFRADNESAWTKMFRVRVRIDGKDYYLGLQDTRLLPFGYRSQCTVEGITFSHELILVEDSLVQRARVLKNPRRAKVQFELVHMESCCAAGRGDAAWTDFAWQKADNALMASRTDPATPAHSNAGPINQKGMELTTPAAPAATTWIGVGCDAPLEARRGYNRRSKWYLGSKPIKGNDAAFFLTFASGKAALTRRLRELRRTVHQETEALLAAHEEALAARPKIATGDPVLDSAFGQYPQVIHSMKLPDVPGAVRGNLGGYFVWGWDGMTPMLPLNLANEADYTAQILRFWKRVAPPRTGIPHTLNTLCQPCAAMAFPAQCQYIASLYHYVAATGDLELARELFPFCAHILEMSRRREVRDTGLVESSALWPDFPQAMGEDGNDISTLNNSLLYQGLRAMEYLAGALGKKGVAARYAEWAVRLRASFVKHLYDEKRGYFISSCSALDFKPRQHYIVHALFWITPFARELVAHAPARIAEFMDRHLATGECLLSLPRWDTAWMADGNQIGASYPTADYFYLNVHKLLGDDTGLKTWLGHVKWFWQTHTAPEAFTPEAENERDLGPDNPGGKQLQAVTCWYASAHQALAGMDIDHEGLTLTPWGDQPVSVKGLKLRGACIDLVIRGQGRHVGSLKLNGQPLPAGSRKIAWATLAGKRAALELTRSEKAPAHPVVVRADGLSVAVQESAAGRLALRVEGGMSGEVVVQAPAGSVVTVGGKPVACPYDRATGCVTIGYAGGKPLDIAVQRKTTN